MSVLLFDIETGPRPDAGEYFNPDSVKLGNLTDPEKIAAKQAEACIEFAEHEACLRGMAGRVVAIGMRVVWDWMDASADHVGIVYQGTGQGSPFYNRTSESGSTTSVIPVNSEAKILEAFWAETEKHVFICGFNSTDFDLPFLWQRSLALGVELPSGVFDGRYLHRFHEDLMRWWACGSKGITGKGNLDQVSRVFGGPPKNGDGALFHKLIAGSPPEQLDALLYLANDLAMTAAVYRGMCRSVSKLRVRPTPTDETEPPM